MTHIELHLPGRMRVTLTTGMGGLGLRVHRKPSV